MTPQPTINDHLNGGRRNRILDQLRTNIQQFPYVEYAGYTDTRTGIDVELTAKIDCNIFLADAPDIDNAKLVVNWWTHPDGPDNFKFHYYDSTSYDCGWHRQENDHVDGLDHFQWRTGPDESYAYEPLAFDWDRPPGVLWEVRDRLEEHLKSRG